jgi:hypothetical protein
VIDASPKGRGLKPASPDERGSPEGSDGYKQQASS